MLSEGINTLEPPNKGNLVGVSAFVLCIDAVHILEGPLSEVPHLNFELVHNYISTLSLLS